jgi:hypothetical protein
MIQTKNVILCNARGQKFGKLKMIISGAVPDGRGGTNYTVKDFIVDENGLETFENEKTVAYSQQQIDATDEYIEANFSAMLIGLTKTKKEHKKIQIGLMLDTQTNLLENGKTTYGLNPNDWEFSE